MAQVQAHQGYFQSDGRLTFYNALVQPPKNKKVTIFWEDEPVEDEFKSTKQKLTPNQREVIFQVMENLEKINKEPIDEETQASFDAFDRGDFRIKFPNRLDDRLDENFNEVQA